VLQGVRTRVENKIARLFHFCVISFNLVESDELSDYVKALCPSYYHHGIPRRCWMATGVDLAYKDLYNGLEEHVQGNDALMANTDGWENEEKQ